EFIGFIDDEIKRNNTYQIYSRDILKKKEFKVLAVPGSPVTFFKRIEIIQSLKISIDRYVTIIHPQAFIGNNVKIGYNCLIMSGVVLTSNTMIGNHVCILPN